MLLEDGGGGDGEDGSDRGGEGELVGGAGGSGFLTYGIGTTTRMDIEGGGLRALVLVVTRLRAFISSLVSSRVSDRNAWSSMSLCRLLESEVVLVS